MKTKLATKDIQNCVESLQSTTFASLGQIKTVIEENIFKDVIIQLNEIRKTVIEMQTNINSLESELLEIKSIQEKVKEPNDEIQLWFLCQHCDFRSKRESTMENHTSITHDE